MKEIAWERTVDGKPARLKEGGKFHIYMAQLLNLAVEKMLDVAIISADFQDNTPVFTKQVGVYLEKDEEGVFCGLYLPDADDEYGPNVPTVCVRQARWDRELDINQFLRIQKNRAEGRRRYVEEEQLVASTVFFFTKEDARVLLDMVVALEQLVRDGVKISRMARSPEQRPWEAMQLEIQIESLSSTISYSAYAEGSEPLEAWLARWQQEIATLVNRQGVIPDDGCFISYPYSLMERIALFPQ